MWQSLLNRLKTLWEKFISCFRQGNNNNTSNENENDIEAKIIKLIELRNTDYNTESRELSYDEMTEIITAYKKIENKSSEIRDHVLSLLVDTILDYPAGEYNIENLSIYCINIIDKIKFLSIEDIKITKIILEYSMACKISAQLKDAIFIINFNKNKDIIIKVDNYLKDKNIKLHTIVYFHKILKLVLFNHILEENLDISNDADNNRMLELIDICHFLSSEKDIQKMNSKARGYLFAVYKKNINKPDYNIDEVKDHIVYIGKLLNHYNGNYEIIDIIFTILDFITNMKDDANFNKFLHGFYLFIKTKLGNKFDKSCKDESGELFIQGLLHFLEQDKVKKSLLTLHQHNISLSTILKIAASNLNNIEEKITGMIKVGELDEINVLNEILGEPLACSSPQYKINRALLKYLDINTNNLIEKEVNNILDIIYLRIRKDAIDPTRLWSRLNLYSINRELNSMQETSNKNSLANKNIDYLLLLMMVVQGYCFGLSLLTSLNLHYLELKKHGKNIKGCDDIINLNNNLNKICKWYDNNGDNSKIIDVKNSKLSHDQISSYEINKLISFIFSIQSGVVAIDYINIGSQPSDFQSLSQSQNAFHLVNKGLQGKEQQGDIVQVLDMTIKPKHSITRLLEKFIQPGLIITLSAKPLDSNGKMGSGHAISIYMNKDGVIYFRDPNESTIYNFTDFKELAKHFTNVMTLLNKDNENYVEDNNVNIIKFSIYLPKANEENDSKIIKYYNELHNIVKCTKRNDLDKALQGVTPEETIFKYYIEGDITSATLLGDENRVIEIGEHINSYNDQIIS